MRQIFTNLIGVNPSFLCHLWSILLPPEDSRFSPTAAQNSLEPVCATRRLMPSGCESIFQPRCGSQIIERNFKQKENGDRRWSLTKNRMAKSNEQPKGAQPAIWECKECHAMISSYETVAYHLVDRILYGWCEPCFINRAPVAKEAVA